MPERGGVGLQQRSLGGNLDRFRRLADLQYWIDRRLLLYVNRDVGLNEFLESGRFGLKPVSAGLDLWKGVSAGAARGLGLACVGVLVDQCDRGVGHRSAAGVFDSPAKAACLRRQRRREKRDKRNNPSEADDRGHSNRKHTPTQE